MDEGRRREAKDRKERQSTLPARYSHADAQVIVTDFVPGTNVVEWIHLFKSASEGFDDVEKLRLFSDKVTKYTDNWYDDTNTNNEGLTINGWILKLLRKFGPEWVRSRCEGPHRLSKTARNEQTDLCNTMNEPEGEESRISPKAAEYSRRMTTCTKDVFEKGRNTAVLRRDATDRTEGPQSEAKDDTADVLLMDVTLQPLITIPVLVGAERLSAVIDTGSQISIINTNAAERLRRPPKEMMPKMRLIMANGVSSEASQSITVPVQVGKKDFEVEFIIVPTFPNEMLLGLDFLLRNDVRIVPAEKEIWINGDRFELPEARQSPRSPGLVTTFNVRIPARKEVILNLAIDGGAAANGSLQLCEAAEASKSFGLLIATSVGIVEDGRMSIRVANPTSAEIAIPPGIVIAQAEQVNEVIEARSFTVTTANTGTNDETSANSGPPLRPFVETELDIGENLSKDEQGKLLRVLDLFTDVMSTHESDTGLTDLIVHQIHTGDAAPINVRPYRLSFAERREVSKLIEEYVAAGFIQESDSPWACPIVLVRKKDGTLRFCCDWRKLNKVTRRDAMPLPRIDDMIDRLAKARFFTKLDFTSGYYQVPLAESAREKTAFVTPDGHYEWLVMGMGLTNAPATFQRLMYKVLGGLLWTNSMAYLDDIVVFSESFEEHLVDLAAVFERIRSAKLKIKPPKCSFAKTGIQYLGFIITPEGIEVDPANTAKVAQFPPPADKTDVRSFLGLTSYYRKFIKNYAFIARPLHDLTKEDVEFLWTEVHQKAFEDLRSALVSPPILAFPNFDKPFIVSTDASGVGIGCILKQHDNDGRERVVAYASRVLTEIERRYSITERECLALRYASQIFRPYLHGAKFKVVTDHHSLTQMRTLKNPTHRLNRFSMDLENFDFDVEYKEGKKHSDADAMSRYGLRETAKTAEVGQRILKILNCPQNEEELPAAEITKDTAGSKRSNECFETSTGAKRMKSIIQRSTDRGKARSDSFEGHPRLQTVNDKVDDEPAAGPSGISRSALTELLGRPGGSVQLRPKPREESRRSSKTTAVGKKNDSAGSMNPRGAGSQNPEGAELNALEGTWLPAEAAKGKDVLTVAGRGARQGVQEERFHRRDSDNPRDRCQNSTEQDILTKIREVRRGTTNSRDNLIITVKEIP